MAMAHPYISTISRRALAPGFKTTFLNRARYNTMQCYPFLNADDPATPPAENFQLVRALDCPAQPVEWLWPGKIPIGKVTLLIGDPGTGKSLVALDIAARVSRGHTWPDESVKSEETRVKSQNSPSGSPLSTLDSRPPSSVLILSASDDLADTIRPRLDAAGADSSRVFLLASIADLRNDFDHLRTAVNCAPNCRLIIIDPINAYVGSSDSHFYSVVRKVLSPLASLAADKRVAVLAVAHLRKSAGAALYRAAGSMGFVASARAIWTVANDRDNPSRQLLLPLKNNLAAPACGLAYSIAPHPQTRAAAITWYAAPITTSSEEALRGPEPSDLHAARIWLRTALAGGPRAASEITTQAEQYGFHERSLRRALHAIGGNTQNRGVLEGWWWSLPAEHSDDASSAAESQDGPQKVVPLCPLPEISACGDFQPIDPARPSQNMLA
jgi:hypothetical protein